ncbi:hypothetical protein BC628DRAFT_1323902 [Trametes gibbosa]|nr:hypothetical protein BC628DRAFT_1323902 [Trametes gibbosa]
MADAHSQGTGPGPVLRAYLDSGAPQDSTNYTTVVIVHGYGWHGGNFKKLMPLGQQFNTRVIVINRRDFPGSDEYTPSEKAHLVHLATTPTSPEITQGVVEFMRARAREVYNFLVDFVKRERIPVREGSTGGLIIAGWSLGSSYMTALLANVRLFPEGDIQLSKYMRRLVMYDASSICFGYPFPPKWYQPLLDTSLTGEERIVRFCTWVTGYFSHGDVFTLGGAALESHTMLADPSPTYARMTPAELAASTHRPPQLDDGSDRLMVMACITHGAYAVIREQALYKMETAEGASDWWNLPVRQVWGDRSIWEMLWCAKMLTEEMEEARRTGKTMREIALVRFEGANHFVSVLPVCGWKPRESSG